MLGHVGKGMGEGSQESGRGILGGGSLERPFWNFESDA